MSTKNYKVKYNSWKRFLDRISYPYSESDFKAIFDSGVKFKSTSCYCLEFYKERYYFYDYELIFSKNKSIILQKRGSMYDIHNVASKYNISLEEAQIVVDNRKKLTNGSLDTFISRYGEELGKIKFEEFKRKCIVTKDGLINKHGEELGTIKWNNYISTRDSGSLEYFLKKYNGDIELANKAHLEFKNLCSKTHTNDYFYSKYGAEYVAELSLKKGYNSTLPYFIAEYGEEMGTLLYQQLNMKKRITLDGMILKYGEKEGKCRYKSWLYTISSVETSKGCVSKAANQFFETLEKALDRKLQYGRKSVEHKLYDDNNNRIYYYDCYDELSNTIIEYNGSLFHPSPLLSESERESWSVGGFGKIDYYTALRKDTEKYELAINNRYNIIIVWDYEINGKIKLNAKLKELIGALNVKNS